jgi:hypothetical protein
MSYKCFDDDIAQDPLERRRGHAGVAICFKNKLQNFIEPLPDGGYRVIAIRLNVYILLYFSIISLSSSRTAL